MLLRRHIALLEHARRRTIHFHGVVILLLLLLLLRQILSLILLRIDTSLLSILPHVLRVIALLVHRHRGISSRHTRRIHSSSSSSTTTCRGSRILILRGVSAQRSVRGSIPRVVSPDEEECRQANEPKRDDASDGSSRDGGDGRAAAAAVALVRRLRSRGRR